MGIASSPVLRECFGPPISTNIVPLVEARRARNPVIRLTPCGYFAGDYSHADIPATEMQSAAPSSAAEQGCVHPGASVEQKVAILAIKGSRVAAPAQRRVDLTPLSLFDRQWAPLLDSLAELCIGKAQHGIVAIGLQASIKEESMVISISTNNDIPTATTTHLRTLWSYLQDISAVFTSRGNPKGNASMNDRHGIPMKPDGEGIVAVHLRDFTRCKYSFSWDRFVRRFRKK